MSPDPSATLLIRQGALGDLLMLLPLVRELSAREGRPVNLVAPAWLTSLLSGFEGIGRVWSLDEAGLWGAYTPGDPVRLPACRRIIAFLKDPEGSLRRRLSEGTGAEVQVHPPFPARATCHMSQYYLDCVFPETPVSPVWPSYQPDPEAESRVQGWLRNQTGDGPFWLLHPGSGSASKNWPIEQFSRVLSRWAPLRRSVVLLLGPAETSRRDSWSRALAFCDPLVVEEWPLEQVAVLMHRCAGYLGNDSGITHLAAVMGAPTVAVFGPASLRHWVPRGPRVCVAAAPSGGWPEPEAVFRAAEGLWPGRPGSST